MAVKVLLVQLVIVAASLVAEYQCGFFGEVAPQRCGTNNVNFYCPVDQQCKPRAQRCNNANICITAGVEDGCFENSTSGRYTVKEGHAFLGSSGSKRTLLEHRFIQYRGFTYEFGASYGVQILDINSRDPDYKYLGNSGINKNGIVDVGGSYCTWQDATRYANGWKSAKYNLFIRNCQHFARGLQAFLTNRTCALPPSDQRKGQDRADQLEQEIDEILTNCDIVCCYNSSTEDTNNGSPPRVSAKTALPLLAGLLLLCMLL